MNRLKSQRWAAGLALSAMLMAQTAPLSYAASANDSSTTTPIKHVVLIIGENRTFDHVFGTYIPPNGQTVWNLLSEGIVDEDGSPGPNSDQALQYQATDTKTFSIHPTKGAPYSALPDPDVGGPQRHFSPVLPKLRKSSPRCCRLTTTC